MIFLFLISITKPCVGFAVLGHGWDEMYSMYVDGVEEILEDMGRFTIYPPQELKKRIDTLVYPPCYIPPPDSFKFLYESQRIRYLIFICITSRDAEIVKKQDSTGTEMYFRAYIKLRLKVYDLKNSKIILNRRIYGESSSKSTSTQSDAEEEAFSATLSDIKYELRRLFALKATLLRKKGKYWIIDKGTEMGIKPGTYFVIERYGTPLAFLRVKYADPMKSYAVVVKEYKKLKKGMYIKELPYAPDFINIFITPFFDYVNMMDNASKEMGFYPGTELSFSIGRKYPVRVFGRFNYIPSLFKVELGLGFNMVNEYKFLYNTIGIDAMLGNLIQYIDGYGVSHGMVGLRFNTENGIVMGNRLYIGINSGVSIRTLKEIDKWIYTTDTDTLDLTHSARYPYFAFKLFDLGVVIKYQFVLY